MIEEKNFQSIDVCNVVYESQWLEMSVKNRRALLLLMIRTRIPITLTLGQVFNLSVDNFVKVHNKYIRDVHYGKCTHNNQQ